MIYITTTNYKKLFEYTDRKLSEVFERYANLSKTDWPLDYVFECIDENNDVLYYGIIKDDIGSILKEEGLSAEDKIEEIEVYLNNL